MNADIKLARAILHQAIDDAGKSKYREEILKWLRDEDAYIKALIVEADMSAEKFFDDIYNKLER